MSVYSRDISTAARERGGEVLAKMRQDAGLSAADVVKALGLAKQTISALEHGKMPLRVVYIEPMAELYGVPVRKLAMEVLKHRDPLMYVLLWGDEGDEELRRWVREVREGV